MFVRALLSVLVVLPVFAAPVRAQILERLWARHLPRCESFAVASDGTAVLAAEWDGTVQAMAEDGHVLWRVKFPSQVVCMPSTRAQLTVAFKPQDPANRKVYLLDNTGKVIRTEIASGPVRTAAVANNGSTVVILSEPGRVTVLRRSRFGWQWQRRLLPGVVTALAVDSAGTTIAVAHRNPSGIEVLDTRLRTRWSYKGKPQTTYRLQISSDGRVLAALTTPPPGKIADAMYWRTDSSTLLWKHTLRGDLSRIQLAPDGKYLAAGYRTRLWNKEKSTVESRVCLFSSGGKALWEVGGLVFGAQLVGASSAPLLVITHDGNRVLAALDTSGHMRARHRLVSPVRLCVMARGGTHFALLTEARALYLFRARN